MNELPRKPHRVEFTIKTDESGRQVLEGRLTMAIAYVIDDRWPGVAEAADGIALAARKGLIKALDDIRRDDIRDDLGRVYLAAREADRPSLTETLPVVT